MIPRTLRTKTWRQGDGRKLGALGASVAQTPLSKACTASASAGRCLQPRRWRVRVRFRACAIDSTTGE
eukprot:247792-Pleurochrysis_carterae.AAC.1